MGKIRATLPTIRFLGPTFANDADDVVPVDRIGLDGRVYYYDSRHYYRSRPAEEEGTVWEWVQRYASHTMISDGNGEDD
jgi:hypothetical protein